jgi:hypothetical protein
MLEYIVSYFIFLVNRIGGVMVSVLKSRLGQTKYSKIGISRTFAKNTELRNQSKDWLSQNQDYVSELSDTSSHSVLG